MKKKNLYSIVTIIALAFLSNACAATGKDDDDKHPTKKPHSDDDVASVTLKLPKNVAEDAEIFVVIGKGGKLEFVGAKDSELRKYHVGENAP